MATLATLTADTYDMLYGMAQVERPAEDTLASSVDDDADVSWTWDTTAQWTRGDYAEDSSDGEIVYIAADTGTTVRRGQRGTTAKVAGYSAGEVFYQNPTYPRHLLERFINETIDGDLFPNVWMWGETTLSYTAGDTTYQLPTNCGDVAQVYQYDLNSDGRFYPIDTRSWEYQGKVNTAVDSNLNILRLLGVHDADETVYVTYKQRPLSSAIADLSDTVAALIPWAVTGKLLAGLRVAPTRTAPGRAQPIVNNQGSQLIRDYAAFDTTFRRMRKDEKMRLQKEVPIQKRWRGTRTRVG